MFLCDTDLDIKICYDNDNKCQRPKSKKTYHNIKIDFSLLVEQIFTFVLSTDLVIKVKNLSPNF